MRFATGVGIVFVLVLLWELYRYVWVSTGWTWPFVVNSTSMPHTWTILKAFWQPAQVNQPALGTILFHKALFTAKEAALGFALGSVFGFGLGIVLAQSRIVQRGVMPYIVASQTIPILAIAPMVVIWVNPKLPGSLQGWGAVAVIAAYLTFFPVVVNTLRGLQSADPKALELMRSYAAGRWPVLWKVQVPASMPFVFSALRIGATASVVGAIIGELPSGPSVRARRGDPEFQPVLLARAAGALGHEHRRGGARDSLLRRGRRRRAVRRAAGAGGGRMNAAEQPVVSVEKLTKTFPRGNVTALSEIDLQIGAGEFIALIGPSGCGKSTLLRVIGDLVEPTAGTVTVNGKTAAKARGDRDYGIVFQDSVLFDWRTVSRNIALPLEMLGWDKERRTARVKEMLDLVELTGFGDHHPWQLSGGMQQRVSIARALAFEPALLLMDEPFGALDEMTRERLNLELLAIWQQLRSTVVFVTHSISEAVFLSTRVVVMSPRPGRISGIVPIDLTYPRTVETREDPQFFKLVTEVRELLRRGGEQLLPEEEAAIAEGPA